MKFLKKRDYAGTVRKIVNDDKTEVLGMQELRKVVRSEVRWGGMDAEEHPGILFRT